MISLDSNIIISVLNPKDGLHKEARALLKKFNQEGYALAPSVYTEIMATPNPVGIKAFLTKADIITLWEMPESLWEDAGYCFWKYISQRKKGKLPRRIAADFLIASHAKYHGLKVMSFDDTVYKAVYPELTVLPEK